MVLDKLPLSNWCYCCAYVREYFGGESWIHWINYIHKFIYLATHTDTHQCNRIREIVYVWMNLAWTLLDNFKLSIKRIVSNVFDPNSFFSPHRFHEKQFQLQLCKFLYKTWRFMNKTCKYHLSMAIWHMTWIHCIPI